MITAWCFQVPYQKEELEVKAASSHIGDDTTQTIDIRLHRLLFMQLCIQGAIYRAVFRLRCRLL